MYNTEAVLDFYFSYIILTHSQKPFLYSKRHDKHFNHVKADYMLTISVIMMGRPYVISLVDSIRMTVRLMVIRTTPPRKAAAPIRANVPEYMCIPRFLPYKREIGTYKLAFQN